tara:strand:+ start:987 stop:1406 length:420 start_codon:yes stop_codon:yes gene_type:complete
MIIRTLLKSDYRDYIELIDGFRPIGMHITKIEFEELYDTIFGNSIIYVAEIDNQIVASVKLLIEQKFIHKLAKYGRIEDVMVNKDYRERGIGKELIRHTVDFCKINRFYKITLSCGDELVPWYEKNGFEVYQNHMSQLL